jgi:hypothetical protein
MNHHQKPALPLVRNLAWRRALQRLNGALAQNSHYENSELLECIGKHMFGGLWRKPENTDSKCHEIEK